MIDAKQLAKNLRIVVGPYKKYNNKIDNNKINPRDEKINFFDL